MNRYGKFLIVLLSVSLMLNACEKERWDSHNKITDPRLQQNLWQAIQQNPDLSMFSQYLHQTGYDTVIASSKTFTVWVPTNESLKNIDPSWLQDTSKLRQLIANHIALTAFTTGMIQDSIRVKTLDAKNIIFKKNQVENANLIEKDMYTSNGILHIIDQPLIPRMNIWEYLNTAFAGSLQQKYLQSLLYSYQDPDSAIQIGVNPLTGQPIYQPGTGIVTRNRYLQKVNISNEDSSLTYIILTDQAYQNEKNKLQIYFQDTTATQTDSVTQWNIVKDLAIQGIYDPDHLPNILYSANDSLIYHLDKSAIISTYRASNGVVYVMNNINYDLTTKIKPIIIQGENFYDRMDPTISYSIITRRDPVTRFTFSEFYMANYGIASYWIRYPRVLNSVKYKVYWVAMNDVQTGNFPMKIAFRSHLDTIPQPPSSVTYDFQFPYTTVTPNNYNEVYLGEYTQNMYGLMDIFLVGNNTTTNGSNTIILDYIKLVPELN